MQAVQLQKNDALPPALHDYLEYALNQASLTDTNKVSINFRDMNYYRQRVGTHPVEMRLEQNETQQHMWNLVFIASFSYASQQEISVSPELYFNFKRGWFYQPDISCCELAHPEVTALFESWSQAFYRQISNQLFNQISIHKILM